MPGLSLQSKQDYRARVRSVQSQALLSSRRRHYSQQQEGTQMRNYYRLLGVPQDCAIDEVSLDPYCRTVRQTMWVDAMLPPSLVSK
jgi:hypothetical protein